MDRFHYVAKDETGKTVRGLEAAADEEELYRKLRARGCYLLSAQPEHDLAKGRRLRIKVLADFLRELGMLLRAGVPLVRALTIVVQEENRKPAEKRIYDRILLLLRQGASFSAAVEAQGNAFPELTVQMLRTAETGGNLDEVCLRLADQYEKEYRITGKLKSAMTYPALLAVVLTGVMFIIFTYVVPQFAELFSGLEELPASTAFLLWLSDALREGWLVLGMTLLFLLLVLRASLSISKVRSWLDRLKLHLPVTGRLMKAVYTARFARTISSLYASGLPMLQALQIASRTVGNRWIEQQLSEVIARVRSGESMSAALGEVDGFVKKFSSALLVGEETGKLDEILNHMADTLDFESERALGQLVSVIEPVMIVIMAVLVGLIITAVIQPLYGAYDGIGMMAG